ncbi:MAG: prolipoprotein diacylglyceryl transferase [Oscillospiraceae bacterium]|nr:prolipoprotein diacylglyceryl transferase [Oscillospiraceae bacterium]
MEPIAIYIGNTIIYWSSIIICLAVAAWFALSYSLYTANGGSRDAMWVFLPIAVFLSVLFSRFIHWYCHTEQYNGMIAALRDYSTGGFCLPGVMLGVALAVLIVKKLRLAESAAEFFDALAPGAALGFALIRLSSLFTSFCRGKIVISNPRFQTLPIGSAVVSANGALQYRFASFFVSFILLLVLCIVMVIFYGRSRDRIMKKGLQKGHCAFVFLLFFCAIEFVIDSSRYDSSFLRSNGLVSLMQILCAVFFVGILVYYSICSVKAKGLSKFHIILWVLFLAAAGCTGYFEYLIQRHGDWYKLCYSVMSISCLTMAIVPSIMYRSCIEK